MADALCGPSNPLQSFKNHSQVDRTLQQDRLTGARHSPARGFRTPDPRAGSLDAEFAAFEAGHQHLFHLQQPPLIPSQSFAPAPQFFQLRQQNVDTPHGWAEDLQKLQLGSAAHQPVLKNQFRSNAPAGQLNTGRSVEGWQDEFMRQQQQRFSASGISGKQVERKAIADLGHLQGQPISQYSFAYQQPGIYREPQRPLGQDAYQESHMGEAERAAFEAAFAQAEGATTSQLAAPQRDLPKAGEVADVRLDPTLSAGTRAFNANQLSGVHADENNLFHNNPTEQEHQIRIGSDVIPPVDRAATRTMEQSKRDADELARVAGQLLSSVADETSTKFEQSQFLALMRRIRDREIEVQGEEFCETNKNDPGLNSQGEAGSLDPSARHESSAVGASSASQISVDELDDEQGRRSFSQADSGRLEMREAESNEQKRRDERMSQMREEFQALHPGGSDYPYAASEEMAVDDSGNGDEDRHKYDHWASGGIGSEEDERIEESPGLAGRFRSVRIDDGA